MAAPERWKVRNTDDNRRVFPTRLSSRGRTLVLNPGEEDFTFTPPPNEPIAFLLFTRAEPNPAFSNPRFNPPGAPGDTSGG